MSEDKINNLISDVLNEIETYATKNLVRFIVIGTEHDDLKNKFLNSLIEELNRKQQDYYRFSVPEPDSEFYKAHKTFLPLIVDHLINENKESNFSPQLKGTNPYKNGKMTIEWEDGEDSEGLDDNENKNTQIEIESDNKSEKNSDLDTDAFAETIQSMVGMLGNQLGNIFSGIQDKLKSIDNQLNEIERDIENQPEENEKDINGDKKTEENIENNSYAELDEISKSFDEIKNKMASSLSSPFDILKNLQSIVPQNIDVNNKIEESSQSLLSEDIRNTRQSNSNSKEFFAYLNELIEMLLDFTTRKNRLVLILEGLDNADEGLFRAFEQIISKYNTTPLTIIGTYLINYKKQGTIRGISNKNLRLLLTNFKLDNTGREICLN